MRPGDDVNGVTEPSVSEIELRLRANNAELLVARLATDIEVYRRSLKLARALLEQALQLIDWTEEQRTTRSPQ